MYKHEFRSINVILNRTCHFALHPSDRVKKRKGKSKKKKFYLTLVKSLVFITDAIAYTYDKTTSFENYELSIKIYFV